jgi:hypothetical protein
MLIASERNSPQLGVCVMQLRAILSIAAIIAVTACGDAPPPTVAPISSTPANLDSYCTEGSCWMVNTSGQSLFDEADCRGSEYSLLRNNSMLVPSWDLQGQQGVTPRTIVARSYRSYGGICRNTGGNTTGGLGRIYRSSYPGDDPLPCEEHICKPATTYRYSYYTDQNCGGYEYAVPEEGGWVTYDGQGVLGTLARQVGLSSRRLYTGVCENVGSSSPVRVRVYRQGTYWAPAPTAGINGPNAIPPWTNQTWTVSVSGGFPPYSYQWFLDGIDAGSTSTTYENSGMSPYDTRDITVIVNDARGAQVVAGISVIVENYTECEDPDNCWVTAKRKKPAIPMGKPTGVRRP